MSEPSYTWDQTEQLPVRDLAVGDLLPRQDRRARADQVRYIGDRVYQITRTASGRFLVVFGHDALDTVSASYPADAKLRRIKPSEVTR